MNLHFRYPPSPNLRMSSVVPRRFTGYPSQNVATCTKRSLPEISWHFSHHSHVHATLPPFHPPHSLPSTPPTPPPRPPSSRTTPLMSTSPPRKNEKSHPHSFPHPNNPRPTPYRRNPTIHLRIRLSLSPSHAPLVPSSCNPPYPHSRQYPYLIPT